MQMKNYPGRIKVLILVLEVSKEKTTSNNNNKYDNKNKNKYYLTLKQRNVALCLSKVDIKDESKR